MTHNWKVICWSHRWSSFVDDIVGYVYTGAPAGPATSATTNRRAPTGAPQATTLLARPAMSQVAVTMVAAISRAGTASRATGTASPVTTSAGPATTRAVSAARRPESECGPAWAPAASARDADHPPTP